MVCNVLLDIRTYRDDWRAFGYGSKLGLQATVVVTIVTLVAMLLHQADAQVYGSCKL